MGRLHHANESQARSLEREGRLHTGNIRIGAHDAVRLGPWPNEALQDSSAMQHLAHGGRTRGMLLCRCSNEMKPEHYPAAPARRFLNLAAVFSLAVNSDVHWKAGRDPEATLAISLEDGLVDAQRVAWSHEGGPVPVYLGDKVVDQRPPKELTAAVIGRRTARRLSTDCQR